MIVTLEEVLGMDAYSNWGRIESTGTWGEVLSWAARKAVSEKRALLAVQPGVDLPARSREILLRHILAEEMICAPTILSMDNRTIELTQELASGYPDMKWAMGTYEQGGEPTQVVCFDHGVIGIPYEALVEVGNFDRGFNEYFVLCDWTVRARWHGHQVYLCHDAPMTVPNHQTFSAVFRGREEAAALLDREHFERKWGGAVLKNLSP